MSSTIYIPEPDLYAPDMVSWFASNVATFETCPDCDDFALWEGAAKAHYLVIDQLAMTQEVINRLEHLRGIIQWGRNLKQIDIAAATKKGIVVAYSPYNTRGMAEAGLLLMLALSKQLSAKMNSVRSSKANYQFAEGSELHGKTLGLVGFNATAQTLSKLATALGMRVLVYSQQGDRRQIATAGGTVVNLVSLLTGADYVSVHRDEQGTSPIFNIQHINMMKPSAYFVNIDHPSLMNEEAITEALLNRRLAGAGLDAMALDSLHNKHPLLKLDNVIITPQALGETAEAYGAIKGGVKLALEAFLAGRLPQYVVNPEAAQR
jgi:phosphoglycerate dehydrogenase-like enzyme